MLCDVILFLFSPRLGDRKHTTCWIKIISHHKPWEILYLHSPFSFHFKFLWCDILHKISMNEFLSLSPQEYPTLVAQSLYASYCHSFPDSYRQFNEQFKEDLVILVYSWIAGGLCWQQVGCVGNRWVVLATGGSCWQQIGCVGNR
jgi:hypothetical protein